jgi:hypothetical protein
LQAGVIQDTRDFVIINMYRIEPFEKVFTAFLIVEDRKASLTSGFFEMCFEKKY